MSPVDWVAGRVQALECLRAGKRKAHKLFILRDAEGVGSLRSAAGGIPIAECTRQELDRLVPGVAHQGVLLEADPLPIEKAEIWIKKEHPAGAVVVALDGVQDPHNFGAVVRSAAAFGAAGVLFPKDRSAPLSPAMVKSSAGGVEHVDLVEAVNLVRAIEGLKAAGFWVAELDEHATQDLWDADLTGRICLVIGSEGKGVRRLVREHSDFHLRIPLPGRPSSLNASVSAAIALAECLRQRR